eukprot:9482684-Pyramimonas_sp.AAC.1
MRSLPAHLINAILDHACSYQGRPTAVRQWLAAVRSEFDIAHADLLLQTSVCSWAPISILVARGRWRVLALHRDVAQRTLKRRGVRRCIDISGELFDGLAAPAVHAVPDIAWGESFSWSMADAFAFKLATWVPLLQGQLPGETPIMESMMRWFLTVGAMCAPSALQVQQRGSHKRAWSCLVLVECLMLSGLLKSSRSLKKVVIRAMAVALPDRFSAMIRECVSTSELVLPHQSQLSRFRLVLDCGLMVWMRRFNMDIQKQSADRGDRLVRTILSDSSPVGLENWQLTEVYAIQCVVRVSEALDELIHLQHRRAAGACGEEDIQRAI